MARTRMPSFVKSIVAGGGCLPCGGSGGAGPMSPPPRSPRMRRANWMSRGMIVTRLAWIAHRLVSSKRPTR
eukprot:6859373-Prymnesium_polylepis.1